MVRRPALSDEAFALPAPPLPPGRRRGGSSTMARLALARWHAGQRRGIARPSRSRSRSVHVPSAKRGDVFVAGTRRGIVTHAGGESVARILHPARRPRAGEAAAPRMK